jgi:hyperosmotically inducible periplasmic protein
MNDRHKLVIWALILIGALSTAGCGKEERVHESWVAPPTAEGVDDSTLNSIVKAALLADPDVRHLDVRVEAHNGEVMLSGIADNQTQMDRVNMLTWMVDGIKKVDNKMSLRSSGSGTGAAAD